ncbi:retrovirus-related pol polyprotein from transposon TNT 1-94 [Tanacetum coccineum]
MELYMQNREHGRMILELVKHGPLIWPTIKENGLTRTKRYDELSATEKIQADCDLKETNIILQGLPTDIYSLVNHHKVAKDLWERVQLLMQDLHTTNFDQLHAYLEQHELHANEVRIIRERNQYPLVLVANHQMTPSHFNTYQSSYNNPQFQQQFSPSQSPQYGSIHPTQHYSTTYPSIPHAITYPSTSHPNPYSSTVHQDACPQPQSIPQIEYTVSTVNQQTHLAECPQIDSCLAVPLRNSSNPRQQATIYDGRVTIQPVQGRQSLFAAGTSGTRANISRIGGNNSGQQRVVKCFNCQGEGHMARQCPKPKRKRDATWFRDRVLLVEAQGSGKVLNEEELEFLADPTVAKVIMANLSSYGPDVLSEVPHSDNTHNDMLNQTIHDINSSTQQDATILYVFEQLSNQVTNCNKVNKDNLIANESLSAELERYKEREKNAQFADFEKEINSHKQTLFEQLKEKESLTKTFNAFKNESKEKEAKNIDNEIALEKKVKELENIVHKMGQSAQTVHMLTKPQVFYDNNLKQALGFQNPFYLKKAQHIRPMLYDDSVIANETNVISIADYEETLMLEEESRSKMLLKQIDPMLQTLHPNTDQSASSPVKIEAPRELPKNSSVAIIDSMNYMEMCNKCLELEAELNKEHNMVEKDEYNKLSKRFSKLEQHCISLEIAMQLNKEIELQAKDKTIEKLKANIKCLNKTSTTNNVKMDIDEIETINIELEHRVTKLTAENEHLKQTYKQFYNSIKPSRVQAKKHVESLVTQLNQKKFKGKDIVNNAAQASNDTTIALGLEIVEHAYSLNLLDSASYSACKYVKLIQELLGYVRDTCPNIHKLSEKLVAVMPVNKKKTVRFVEPVISSSTSQKQLGSSQTKTKQTTNNSVSTSTRVSRSTKSSRSKSTDNTKNDMILQISSSTKKKNKVEDHSRIVKSSLNKTNYVVKPSGNTNVHHSKLNINSELMCVKCNSFMFDARHELCFLEFVSDMNMSSKSKSVKKTKKKEEWKPTGKVFTKIGYQWRPTGRTFNLVENTCPLTRITATNKVPLREPIPLEVIAQKSVVTKVYTRRPKVPKTNGSNSKPKIMWNIIISRVYHVEGLGHNLFSVGKFCDSDLEVAFRKHMCFVRNLEGDVLLLGSQETKLYTLSMGDMIGFFSIVILLSSLKDQILLTAMASEQLGSGLRLQCMTLATSSSGLVPNPIP